MKNNKKWFEETFLPSLEAKMNNPKYPNQVILTEAQAMICEKYMEKKSLCGVDYNGYFTSWSYQIGEKHYSMNQRGRYVFLNLKDESKHIYYLVNIKTNERFLTFKSKEEREAWMEENVDDETGDIKGMEHITHWICGDAYEAKEEA